MKKVMSFLVILVSATGVTLFSHAQEKDLLELSLEELLSVEVVSVVRDFRNLNERRYLVFGINSE